MTLFSKLQDALKRAMLARDELQREALRMVIAAAKNRRIELGRELSDEDVVAVLQKGVKSRQDSAGQYRAAGRLELAEKEEAEIAVLEAWLPKQLDEPATRAAAAAVIAELGLTSKKDLGRLMKELLARHQGQIDGKLASRLAGELLP